MSLRKAIASGKEHRVEYGTKDQPFCKSVDKTCRNHGGRPGGSRKQCPWCLGNRTYANRKREEKANYDKGENEEEV